MLVDLLDAQHRVPKTQDWCEHGTGSAAAEAAGIIATCVTASAACWRRQRSKQISLPVNLRQWEIMVVSATESAFATYQARPTALVLAARATNLRGAPYINLGNAVQVWASLRGRARKMNVAGTGAKGIEPAFGAFSIRSPYYYLTITYVSRRSAASAERGPIRTHTECDAAKNTWKAKKLSVP
jgi:hypothetical protein